MRDIYVNRMIEMASADARVYALDADLANSVGMGAFMKALPGRLINCGIQESNMVGAAAGLSASGLIPFLHTFAVFATRRVMDQVFLSCGFSRWNVKIVGSDPGITAAYNGGTHMPFEDIGTMRLVPGITIIEATDCAMLHDLLPKIKDSYGVHYLRLTRKASRKVYEENSSFEIGKAVLLRDGSDITLIASGYCVAQAIQAAEILREKGIQARVLDMFTIKPIDRDAILAACQETGAIVTAENHNVINGLGSAVAEVVVENCPVPMERVGVKDEYGEVGEVEWLAERFHLTSKDIAAAAERVVARKAEK